MPTDLDIVTPEAVEQQLRRLRSSPLFSNSRRYPTFLDYVVRKTLEGQGGELKERTVGVEAFGRASSYDLNSDPIVRVTAGEVRKRLAQYYYQLDHQQELRIELRPGSYVPEFRLVQGQPVVQEQPVVREQPIIREQPGERAPRFPSSVQPFTETVSSAAVLPDAQPAVEPSAPSDIAANTKVSTSPPVASHATAVRTWRSLALSSTAALLAVCVAGGLLLWHRPSATDRFWQPVTQASGPVFLSVGSVVAMVNSNAVAPAPSTVSGHPLASDPIAVSDATALSSIQQVLSIRSKATMLASSTSTSFSDLQKGPDVLISGFNNQWTMRITEPLRFHFARRATDEYAIVDEKDPTRRWSINTAAPFVKMTTDFGLVARFHDPTTEQIVVVAAGIGENGTVAASRVLTDEKLLQELRQNGAFPAPQQDFEAVVETQIIDGRPGPPRILATYLW